MKLVRLMTDSQIRPLSAGMTAPVFSWNAETGIQNWKQTSWRVTVAENTYALEKERGLLWDSGEIYSDCMTGVEYAGKKLSSDTKYYWKVRITGTNGTSAEECSCFRTALLHADDWSGQWIGETEDGVYHIFRKTFSIEKEIEEASLYVCGLGHCDTYLNGKKIDSAVLNPGWTNYDKSCLYSCYDVTRLLTVGENGLGLILGDGMYNVPGGRYVYYPRSFGKCKFLLQLNVVYKDGERFEIFSDTSWKMAQSAITFSCIYGGEVFDARMKKKGFSLPNYEMDKQWKQTIPVEPPKGVLIPQNISPTKVMKHYELLNSGAVTEIAPGKFLCDFGTNFSGWINAKIKTDLPRKGHKITFTPAEILDKNGMPDQRVTGQGYCWTYIMDGTLEQEFHPRFSYTGFRYVLVEGAVPLYKNNEECYTQFQSLMSELPVLECLTGEFIYPEDMEGGGFFCSDKLFNQIHQIICQAILSNTKSIFTDCPHREKLGWLEQTYLIGPSIMYNYNVSRLYEKIERDMLESQNEDGLIPNISPQYVRFGYHEGFNDSPEWGSAAIINAWNLYKRFGNRQILERYYPFMQKYIRYLSGKLHHYILYHGLGDWLDIGPMTPYSQNTPVPITATCIFYHDLTIMRCMAELLNYAGDVQDYDNLLKKVHDEYFFQFFDTQTGRVANGSQTAQAMSLAAGLVPDEYKEKVINMLVQDIIQRGYQTTAGDIGHPFVIAVLMQYGYHSIIEKMLSITDKPGYGYQVVCGATTLTEEWDGPEPGRPHGSQNHLMLGSAEEWFYSGLAGINIMRGEASVKKIQIKPYFSEKCDFVRAWTMHPYGRIDLSWRRENQNIVLDFTIPPNGDAEFWNMSDQKWEKIGSGKYHYELPTNTKSE